MEDTKLSFVDQRTSLCLFTLVQGEDGVYRVTDCREVTEETNEETLKEYLEEAEIGEEQYTSQMMFAEVLCVSRLLEYAWEHQEIEAFELNGEYQTLDGLNDVAAQMYREIFSVLFTDPGGEDVLESVVGNANEDTEEEASPEAVTE